jgi:hypothetical protein
MFRLQFEGVIIRVGEGGLRLHDATSMDKRILTFRNYALSSSKFSKTLSVGGMKTRGLQLFKCNESRICDRKFLNVPVNQFYSYS